MKALPLLLSLALFTTGCDMDKITGLQSEPATPVAEPRTVAAPRTGATPTPAPKQGDWMWKNYKRPLDPPKR